MSNAQMHDSLRRVLRAESDNCERAVICVREDGRAGFALLGPNMVVWSYVAIMGETPEESVIFDQYLN